MNNFLIAHPPDHSVLDNCDLIKENPDAQIHKLEIFGTNYVEAIQIEHIIKNVSSPLPLLVPQRDQNNYLLRLWV